MKTELENLKASYAELTTTYKDIIQKYLLLTERLDADFRTFSIEIRNRILQRKETCTNRKNDIRETYNTREIQLRNQFEERIKTHGQKILQLVQDVANLTN